MTDKGGSAVTEGGKASLLAKVYNAIQRFSEDIDQGRLPAEGQRLSVVYQFDF